MRSDQGGLALDLNFDDAIFAVFEFDQHIDTVASYKSVLERPPSGSQLQAARMTSDITAVRLTERCWL